MDFSLDMRTSSCLGLRKDEIKTLIISLQDLALPVSMAVVVLSFLSLLLEIFSIFNSGTGFLMRQLIPVSVQEAFR